MLKYVVTRLKQIARRSNLDKHWYIIKKPNSKYIYNSLFDNEDECRDTLSASEWLTTFKLCKIVEVKLMEVKSND